MSINENYNVIYTIMREITKDLGQKEGEKAIPVRRDATAVSFWPNSGEGIDVYIHPSDGVHIHSYFDKNMKNELNMFNLSDPEIIEKSREIIKLHIDILKRMKRE